jgi:hypothetical protein
MRLFRGHRPLLLWLFAALAVVKCSAVAPDSKILSLVPPDAEVVAGMSASSQPENFLVADRSNIVDLNDFYALTGVDSTRVIHEVILVAAAAGTDRLVEHSLLASGSFDQTSIYEAALENGAVLKDYVKTRVLVVQPFARERATFNHVRWLAVLDSKILIFGTIGSVQQELNRHWTRSKADSSLVEKLAHLRRDDETWSVLTMPAQNSKVRTVLAILDPKLAELAGKGDTFQFGIRYGRHIEFEYEVTTASSTNVQTILDALGQSLAGSANASALAASTTSIRNGNTARGVIKLSQNRYNAWLEEVLALNRGTGTTFR